jgi:hypothetical protein
LLICIKSPVKIEDIPLRLKVVLPIPTEELNLDVTAVETIGDCIIPFSVISVLVLGFFDLNVCVLPIPTEVNDNGIGLKSSAFSADDAS